MAKAAAATLLIPLLFFTFSARTLNLVNGQKTWCIAKPSSDPKVLGENIDYACSQVDCTKLQTGCCSSPDYLINRVSLAMNLYYQCKGRNKWNCDFKNSALISVTDPSYGCCVYD